MKSVDREINVIHNPVTLYTRVWIEIFVGRIVAKTTLSHPLHEGVD